MKVPRNEMVWTQYYDKSGTLRFLLTAKDGSRDTYIMYESVDGELRKVGKGKSPLELEEKFKVNKAIGFE